MMMMKLFLLLATLVAAAEALAKGCFTIFIANNANGLLFGQNYSKVTSTGAELITQSVPFYFSEAAALALKTPPAGRSNGFYSKVSATGPLALNFYNPKTSGWISIYLGRGAANFGVPNVINGGTGFFTGIQGTITRVPISSAISNYTLCPTNSKFVVQM